MPTQPPAPRQRPRLSEEETERRLLDTAVRDVLERGMPLSLDRLGFENLIRDAGVSRTTVYRRWGSKEGFYTSLLAELVLHDQHGVGAFTSDTVPRLLGLLTADLSWRATPEGRRAMLVELARTGADANVNSPGTAAQIRVTVGMVALLNSPVLTDEIVAALTRSESEFRASMEQVYTVLGGLVGYRPRRGLDWGTIATLGSAFIVGTVVEAPGSPVLQAAPAPGDPFGTGRVADWTAVTTGYTALILSLSEPDPDFDPDADLRPLLGLAPDGPAGS